MKHIVTHVDTDKDLTTHVVTGDVTGAEIKEATSAFHENDPTMLVLWDFTEADVQLVTSADIEMIVNVSLRYGGLRVGGKTATLFASPLGYGLGRMYNTHQELGGSSKRRAGFRDRDEALAWLFTVD